MCRLVQPVPNHPNCILFFFLVFLAILKEDPCLDIPISIMTPLKVVTILTVFEAQP